jgi:glycosyltransferase involved in cell wall biosynthesis
LKDIASQPLISVIMPTYNSALYIRQAVDSILNQTYRNFEFLIFDDCSKDDTFEIIKSYGDERIQLFRKDKNTGYTDSLIKGINNAKGKYIARMDSDDISHTSRFEKQVAFLETNPDYGIVGSFTETIANGDNSQLWEYPVEDNDIRIYTIVNSPFVHPAVMIRKDVLERNHLTYIPTFEPCEDYKLWVDLLKVSKGKNIAEPLLYYRLHEAQTISLKRDALIKNSNKVRQEVIRNLFGIQMNESEVDINYYFFNEIKYNTAASIEAKYYWRRKLREKIEGNSDSLRIGNLLDNYWIKNLRVLSEYKLSFLRFFFEKNVVNNLSLMEIAKSMTKCLLGYKIKLH